MGDSAFVEDVDGTLIPKAANTVESRDQYVVCREPLARVVTTFVTDWRQRHEPDGGRSASEGTRRLDNDSQVRAYQWLALETKWRDPHGVGISEIRLQEMFRREPDGTLRHKTISHQIADALVTAMGRPDIMNAPEMTPVRRNSRGCCRGFTGGFGQTF